MRVAALVVHFRNWPQVADTLTDVLDQGIDELVVVDNASGDGSATAIREAFPAVRVVESPANRGYAAGMNAGMRELLDAGVDAVLMLTHEVRLDVAAVQTLVDRMDAEPSIGAVGPLVGLLERRDVVWSAGGKIDPDNWTVRHLGAGQLVTGYANEPYGVDWLDGCAILLRAAALRAVGPLDEGYFLYYEEVDYLWRLANRGWHVECVPSARVWQQPGSPPRALLQRNRLRFVRSAGGWGALARALEYDIREIRYGWGAGPEKRAEAKQRIRGVFAFLTGRMP